MHVVWCSNSLFLNRQPATSRAGPHASEVAARTDPSREVPVSVFPTTAFPATAFPTAAFPASSAAHYGL